MIKLLFFSFFALSAPSRNSHYTCSLDLALAANDASASIVSGKVSGEHHANLIGRGVANCKSESGFQFNLPAVMAISLNSEEELPLQSIRASIEPVSVDHNVNKIFDQYTPHVELRNTPTLNQSSSSDRAIVVKGLKNDLLMQVNLSLPADSTASVSIAKVDLKIDNDATENRNSKSKAE